MFSRDCTSTSAGAWGTGGHWGQIGACPHRTVLPAGPTARRRPRIPGTTTHPTRIPPCPGIRPMVLFARLWRSRSLHASWCFILFMVEWLDVIRDGVWEIPQGAEGAGIYEGWARSRRRVVAYPGVEQTVMLPTCPWTLGGPSRQPGARLSRCASFVQPRISI